MAKKKYSITTAGPRGNAFNIMGEVTRAMRNEGKTPEEIEAYTNEAMASDYSNLVYISKTKMNELNKE